MQGFRALASILFTLCFPLLTQSQPLTQDDFNVGVLKLNSQFDSLQTHLGKPDSMKADHVFPNYIESFYHGLIVWHNKSNHRILGFDIQDSSFVTSRRLRLGDSLSRIHSLYGFTDAVSKKFVAFGPYDARFRSYTQVTYYRLGDFHVAFFTNGQVLVRMFFYLQLDLGDDDWKVAFLKLDSPFNSATDRLGKPDSTTPGDYGSTGFYFRKLVLWRDVAKNTLCAMDIYDSSFVTHRGLRVGDPEAKIDSLYYYPDRVEADFRRFGPYDYTFKDFSEASIYESGPYFFVIFTREHRIVKLLLYVGVDE